MPTTLTRRGFIALGAATAALACVPGCRSAEKGGGTPKRQARLFFTSQGKTALINANGTGLHYFDFKVPEQVTWQPGPFLSDGRRVIVIEYPDPANGALIAPARRSAVLVRGTHGAIFDTDAASQPHAIAWVADGMQYQVGGAFTADELISLAEQLR